MMQDAARTTTRRCCPPRSLPALLLAVLLGGLTITTFTRGWLGAIPFHDHLVAGDHRHNHSHGVAQHAHDGDELARALAAWQRVEAPATAGESGVAAPAGRVISLRAATAVLFVVGAFSFVASFAALLGRMTLARGVRLVALDDPPVAGRLLAPLTPPPRFA